MKFFLADSQDLIDPGFDFKTEQRAVHRVRQRDDLYAHELFADPPLDGVLVSKAIVDGCGAKPGKYTLAQRNRLRRSGIRRFFRLDARQLDRRIATMGDCGAFSYVNEPAPPYSVAEVIAFYEECGVDFGISVDHVILGYRPDVTATGKKAPIDGEHRRRQKLTLDLASDFRRQSRRASFVPVGVAQGWGPASYADAVAKLQRIGYDHIALGGMVPLKTPDIIACLDAVARVRRPETKLHLLGVTRCENARAFASYGVHSFDTTSPLLQAFRDGDANYHTPRGAFTAIRVPQADGNTKFRRDITAGRVNQEAARSLEADCLAVLRKFDKGKATTAQCLSLLSQYESLFGARATRIDDYRRTLEHRPWKECPCEVCRALGIEVMLFRGSERNKRRGFHNLYVFYKKLRAIAAPGPSSVRSPRPGHHGIHTRRGAAAT